MPRLNLPRAADESARVRLRGSTFNRIMRELEAARNLSAEAPLRAIVGQDGAVIKLEQGPEWEWAILQEGDAITAANSGKVPGSGPVTLERFDGSAMVETEEVTVRNRYRDAVAGPKIVRVSMRGPGGLRWLLGVGCSPP